MPELVRAESQFDFVLLDISYPSWDGVAEILYCNSSGLTFSLEEQKAALIDCANQAAVTKADSE